MYKAPHGPPHHERRATARRGNTPASRNSSTLRPGFELFGSESVRWKHEIKRLVELLLITEDLRTVESLNIQLQRAGYFHMEQTQRKLIEVRPAFTNDSSGVEISLA